MAPRPLAGRKRDRGRGKSTPIALPALGRWLLRLPESSGGRELSVSPARSQPVMYLLVADGAGPRDQALPRGADGVGAEVDCDPDLAGHGCLPRDADGKARHVSHPLTPI